MISDAAAVIIRKEIEARRCGTGVYSAALYLFQENFQFTKASNPAWTTDQIEVLLLCPSGLTSLLDQSEKLFGQNARAATMGHRLKIGLAATAWNIFLNIVASALFVLISLVVYLSFQETARSALQSFGIQVAPIGIVQPAKTPENLLRLPPPQKPL